MILRFVPILLTACCSAVWAGEQTGTVSAKTKLPGVQYLQPGEMLKGIRTVRYAAHRLDAEMTLRSLSLIDATHVLADLLNAVIYGEDKQETRISTNEAVYDLEEETIRSESPTKLEDPRFRACGSGLMYDLKTKRGFLNGPVRTVLPLRMPQKTHSNTQP